MQAPWDGLGPLGVAASLRGESPWSLVARSAVAAGPGWPTPHELTEQDLDQIVELWSAAARRAAVAGFQMIDFHGAHGYLLHASSTRNWRRGRRQDARAASS
jgi:2,4-dienoyl-CoA reductase-like NADH-dependent reductase (Old Yellow Enzyme family)